MNELIVWVLIRYVGIGLVLSLNTDFSLMGIKVKIKILLQELNKDYSFGSSLGTTVIGCILIVGGT
ncbi:hypothetical protein [Methanobrevibacter sp.]|uniref:hypothetical protein n=1 Tax=Methanobrevibacter sp. TaxID=66852 RepID=UPI0025CC6C65|nr:hypothetical protein [Methanobrevibacter sp.]MEE0942129.1 hypothetical protein [Methanobrevibacter sp.]